MVALVVNLGLKSVRCIAFTSDGRVLAQHSRPIRTSVSNERVEQDPREWQSLTWDVVRSVTSELGGRVDEVEFVTVTTSASCLVPTDESGRPLRDAILVSDTRATKEATRLSNTVEFQGVRAEGGFSSSADLMLPKILWLQRYEPDVAERTSNYLNAGDFLVAQLTGEFVTDPNNASKFHYLGTRDAYPERLLDSLGIDPKTLPSVQPMGSEVGSLRADAAEELGLPETCHVRLSTYDALAAVTGTGAFEVGEAVDVSGTVTSFRAVTDHHLYDPAHRIYVTEHIGRNRWLAGGSNNLGGGIIEWLRDWMFEGADDPYADMEELAAGQPPCPGGLVFLPHLLGERAPVWNPDCRGVFFGLNRAHGRGEIVRAVLEGACFSARHIGAVLEDLDVPVESVAVSGGLSRLDVVNQIKADMFGVPVKKPSNFETTSIGAALIGLVGTGVYEDGAEGFEEFCDIDRVYEPDPDRHAVYREYMDLYRDVYDSLSGAYSRRARLLEDLREEGVDELVIAENL